MNVRKTLLVLSAVAAIVIGYFAGRNWILNRVFQREKEHLRQAYGLRISVEHIGFDGFANVRISGLKVLPEGQDTLATADEMKFHLSLAKLLTGSIAFNKLSIRDVVITAYNRGEQNNLAFLKQYKKGTSSSTEVTDSYKGRVESRQNEFLRLLNTAFDAQNIIIIYADTNSVNNLYISNAQFDLHKLSATIINRDLSDTIALAAEVLKENSSYSFDLHHTGNDTTWLPFLNRSPALKCKFKSLNGELKFAAGDASSIKLNLNAQQLRLNYWRLAKDDVVMPKAQFSTLFKITDSSFELDSTSTLVLGGASFKLFALYQRQPDTLIAFNIQMPEIPSDTFFNAVPDGMFTALKGISCSGTLAYDLDFSMHTNQPDSLVFISSLRRKNFHIVHYGEDNLSRINGPFLYDAYQGTHLLRKIEIGPENPAYTSINNISRFLPLCIMQSEDPGFMEHRGFIPEAMRESIAQDFKEKRFARGGSTISMQLVKNVFLKRDKTISRKVEEALIVYLIENLQLVSKERMMEVYLNAIEWGPDIYGIGEASNFYFHKSPAQLTLPECVFLAAIIPNPRSFRYQFDKTGHVKSYITDFYKLITGRLITRNLVSEADIPGEPDIKLYGPAARMVLPGDSLPKPEENLEDDME